jgi:hypothetical protein
MIPISQENIEPKISSNILYVGSIEEFIKIPLEPNKSLLAFDNYRQCFYIKACDKYGVCGDTKVYFYEDFASRAQNSKEQNFYDKCKALKYDSLRTLVAKKFFLENEKPMTVWLWLLETKQADWEYDTVKHLKCKMKKELLDALL